MSDVPGDRSLLNLWRGGNQQAAQELFNRYLERLVALARHRISQRLASRVDPEDVVQSVFRTFFNRAQQGQFVIENEDDLCKLLVRITLHKTLRQVEFHRAAKRNPSLETGQADEDQERLMELLDSGPSPADANVFLDELEHFLQKLKPQERQILELRMQGYGTEEIAEKLGTYDRKVRRVMERIRGLAEQEGIGV